MTREDIIAMAREAGIVIAADSNVAGFFDCMERFAALFAAAERNKLAAWMTQRAYATGHGDTTEDLLVELEWQVRESERTACAEHYTDIMRKAVMAEREACAKVCDSSICTAQASDAIRARSNNT